MNHPQIAIFARLAKENTPYVRSIEGQKSLLGRTMHDFAYDEVHDEIVVTSALAQALLTLVAFSAWFAVLVWGCVLPTLRKTRVIA